ncbi:MAG: hypothetical protein O7H41_21075 [Planctomycetota bacterium]|nr:hypothetical protein [Planctomycetota bacterium]
MAYARSRRILRDLVRYATGEILDGAGRPWSQVTGDTSSGGIEA